MKQLLTPLLLLTALLYGCKQERFIREASAFPTGYAGRWEVILPGTDQRVFQAGVHVEPSGDSLLWTYFSQLVDTVSHQVIPCGPEVARMPVWWDDSTQTAQANHGADQGYGYDVLRLRTANQLQLNSLWLATSCRGIGGFNSTQLILSRVQTFRYEP